jgi:hypothetical protein
MWKGQWILFPSTPPTGGTKRFEIGLSLIVFGILYVAVVEILEKCEQRHADVEQEALLHRQVAP